MAGSYSITRISDSELDTVKPSDYHVIGAISRDQEVEAVGDDPRSGTYVEVKPDRRLPLMVSRDRSGTVKPSEVLLIEVDDPGDPDALELFKEKVRR